MTEGYFNYEHLENLLLKDKGKINDKTAQKFKLKLVNEKKPLDNTSNDKINKEPKNNINGRKDNGIVNDTPNPDKIVNKPKSIKDDNYNIIINEILAKKETKLLTDSQYVSFENQIGDNSCYINVIMHFLYYFLA